MAEHSKNIKTLLELIKENPELPVVPMADAEMFIDDCNYKRWHGTFGTIRIGRYFDFGEFGEHTIVEGDYDVLEVLRKYLPFCEDEKIPDNETECQKIYDSLPWIKAIIVNIDS